MFDLSRLTEWLKLSAVRIAAVLLASGFLMFAPDVVHERLGVTGLVAAYRGYIGLALVGSAALLVAMAGEAIWGRAKPRLDLFLLIRRMRPRLDRLTPAEKDVLRPYLKEKTRTQYFQLGDGVVAELVTARILHSFNVSAPGGMSWAHNIQPWAWDHLNKHPDLLKGKKARKS